MMGRISTAVRLLAYPDPVLAIDAFRGRNRLRTSADGRSRSVATASRHDGSLSAIEWRKTWRIFEGLIHQRTVTDQGESAH